MSSAAMPSSSNSCNRASAYNSPRRGAKGLDSSFSKARTAAASAIAATEAALNLVVPS
tara:strand:- start:2339 stop:2512 length:174 start_codon:yes stop_codon:yes gene_type:complete